MPELPEVETITRALRPHLEGREFTRIVAFRPDVRFPLTVHKNPNLLNCKISVVRRRARYLLIELENLEVIIIHLGMSGSIRIAPIPETKRKHEHVIFHLDNGQSMRFDCPRRFGFVKNARLSSPGADPEELCELGPEPLSRKFTGKYLHETLRGRSLAIKSALMDNRIVVGCGNIYANEALFRVHVHPVRPAGKLTIAECGALAKEVKKVLKEAIKSGGTTIIDFKGVDGSEGKFVQKLQIYGKAGQKCARCGHNSVERCVIGGRATYFCGNCQR